MTWRHQLPTRSPVTGAMVAAACRADPAALPELERAIAAEYAVESVLLTGSGTVALSLALLARGPGPRVVLPAWGCPDLVTAADAAGAKVHLYDLDPLTLGPAPGSLERSVEGGVDVVVTASFFGIPFDATNVRRLAASVGALLVDDAAQGAGGRFLGKPLGVQGDLGVLSFGRGKGRTGGSGGALLGVTAAGHAAIARVRERLLPAGRGGNDALKLAAMAVLARPSIYRLPASLPWLRLGETIYHPPSSLVGMSRAAAAALLAGTIATEAEAAIRRGNASRWIGALESTEGIALVKPSLGAEPGWLRFPILVAADDRRAELLDLRSLGVMPGYPTPIASWLAPGRLDGGGSADWPGATYLASRLLTLPTHGGLRPSEQAAILSRVGPGASRSLAARQS